MDALVKGTGENLLLDPDPHLEKNMDVLVKKTVEICY
jgi:hypothetical protein